MTESTPTVVVYVAKKVVLMLVAVTVDVVRVVKCEVEVIVCCTAAGVTVVVFLITLATVLIAFTEVVTVDVEAGPVAMHEHTELTFAGPTPRTSVYMSALAKRCLRRQASPTAKVDWSRSPPLQYLFFISLVR